MPLIPKITLYRPEDPKLTTVADTVAGDVMRYGNNSKELFLRTDQPLMDDETGYPRKGAAVSLTTGALFNASYPGKEVEILGNVRSAR